MEGVRNLFLLAPWAFPSKVLPFNDDLMKKNQLKINLSMRGTKFIVPII